MAREPAALARGIGLRLGIGFETADHMDWKLFTITFGSVFLSEFGDKTQLATLAFSGSSRKPWVVFLAASVALVAATALGAAAGGWLGRVVPEVWIRRGAALLFIGIGIWMLAASWRSSGA